MSNGETGIGKWMEDLIVAVYDDQTAEVKEARTFEEMMDDRRATASALRASADALKLAVNDPNPPGRAKVEMDKLLKAAQGRTQSYRSFLQSASNTLTVTPAIAETPEQNVRQQAERLDREANYLAHYFEVRRLP